MKNWAVKSMIIAIGVVLVTFLAWPTFPVTLPVTAPVQVRASIDDLRAITPFIVAYNESGDKMWSASGVWIDKIHVLTARHVVQDPDSGTMPDHWDITDSKGKVHTAGAVALDLKHDAAMLTIADEYDGPVAEISTDVLQVGDQVVCCGWMVGLGLETTFGQVANVASDPNEWGEGDMVCAIVCTYGASGGPVFHDGKLIGIVSRGRDSLLVMEPVILFGVK